MWGPPVIIFYHNLATSSRATAAKVEGDEGSAEAKEKDGDDGVVADEMIEVEYDNGGGTKEGGGLSALTVEMTALGSQPSSPPSSTISDGDDNEEKAPADGGITKDMIRSSGVCVSAANSIGRWVAVVLALFSSSDSSSDEDSTKQRISFGIYEVILIITALLGSAIGIRLQTKLDVKKLAGLLDGMLLLCSVTLIITGLVDTFK
jgi:hypothetical protein